MDCSLPGSSICGIQQARILEWVAMLFSRASSRTRDQTQVSCIGGWVLYCLSHRESQVKMLRKQICTGAGNYQTAVVRDRGKRYRLGNQTLLLLLLVSHFSRVRLCATPETAAHQAPPSLGFSQQEHYLSVTHHMSFMSSLTSQVYSFPQV